MKIKLKKREEIAESTILLTFDTLGQEFNFIPGQFVSLKLVDPLYVDQGPSLKYFSMVNSPSEQGVVSIATRLRGSNFKKSLNEMSIGSEVEIGEAMGDFVLPDNTTKHLVFIAGGIGITPYISMLRHIKDNNLDYKIILIYANQAKETTAFLDELISLEKVLKNFKLILIMTQDENWQGENRKIDESFIKDYFSDFQENIYYIVGGPGIVNDVSSVLDDMGIERENIKTEIFPGY